MKSKLNLIIVTLIAISIFSYGCSGKKEITPEIVVAPTLTLNKEKLDFYESDSTQAITVQTNASYTASSPLSWCTFQQNGSTLQISVAKMSSADADRTATIIVTAGTGNNKVQKQIQVSQKRNWTLVWEDNFDADGPVNSAKWTLVNAATSDWNRYMTPTNDMAFVQGGNLILKAIKDAAGYKTSGVDSRNKFSIKYGKIEVRAKLPAGQGTWPAIWMMPQSSVYGGWPKSGEIDIMEHLNNDTKVYNVIHSNYVDNLGQKTNPVYMDTPSFNVGNFNTFGIEWYPDKIDFFVNGTKSFSYPKRTDISADQLQWPFDQPFYIILNTALGGSWVGSINDAILPVQTEIDYVKVYSLSKY